MNAIGIRVTVYIEKYSMYNLARWIVMQEHEIILYQLENTNIYVNIIFKEERENIKLKAGESIYLDLVDMIFDFFVKAFADKRAQQINTMSSHLRKISNR